MSDFDLVKSQVDIVSYIQSYVSPLKKEGRLYVGLCPFHNEQHGSFKVNPDTQRWQCFGACGVGGSVIDFAMKFHHMTEAEALQDVAQFAGITLEPLSATAKDKAEKHARLFDLLMASANFYQDCLYSNAQALSYMYETRKIDAEVIDGWRLGYAPNQWQALYTHLTERGYSDTEMIAAGVCAVSDKSKKVYDFFRGRIMIPLHDQKGHVIGFGGRAFDEGVEPKYLNSKESDFFDKSSYIYGLSSSGKNWQGEAQTRILVEGYMDVLQSRQNGVFNTVASMGTSLTPEQLKMLCKGDMKRIVLCFDNDLAGETAMKKHAAQHLHTASRLGVDLLIMRPPHGKDADDTLREKPELWQAAVDNARTVVEVLVELELSSLGQQATGVQKSNMARSLLPILKNDDPFITKENFKILSSHVDIPLSDLESWAARQPYVMPKPDKPMVPQPQSVSGLPTTEEWVLHGILKNEADGWLARANACLFLSSDQPMPYGLAPLSPSDFTEPHLRRFFEASVKAQAEEQMIRALIDTSLETTYEHIKRLDKIGDQFGLTLDYDAFIGHVYELRSSRLQKEHPAFKGEKARECAMAIACLQLAQEDLI